MEEVYKINSNIPSSFPHSSPQSPKFPENKHATVYVAVAVLIIAFIGIVFYALYNNIPDTEDIKEERVIYTYEEKLKILEGLVGDPVDIPPIEERKKILSEIAESKPADAKKYSQQEKLDILYSLQ